MMMSNTDGVLLEVAADSSVQDVLFGISLFVASLCISQPTWQAEGFSNLPSNVLVASDFAKGPLYRLPIRPDSSQSERQKTRTSHRSRRGRFIPFQVIAGHKSVTASCGAILVIQVVWLNHRHLSMYDSGGRSSKSAMMRN